MAAASGGSNRTDKGSLATHRLTSGASFPPVRLIAWLKREAGVEYRSRYGGRQCIGVGERGRGGGEGG